MLLTSGSISGVDASSDVAPWPRWHINVLAGPRAGLCCDVAEVDAVPPAPAYGESAPSYLMVRPPPTRPSPNDIDCAWSILTSRRRYLTAMHSTEGDRKTGSRRSA